MQPIAEHIFEYAVASSEGTPIVAKELLHLGTRAAIDQALSRLAQRGALLRVGRGIYVLPVATRFGQRAPSAERMAEGFARQRLETVVPHGAAAANALGLTTQVPVREVYLTSGRSRRLKLGARTVEFRHAPVWQLMFPGSVAGEVLRVLAWLGPENVAGAIAKLRAKLNPAALSEIASARACMPTWMAQQVSALMANG